MAYKGICLSFVLCGMVSMHAMQRGPMAWLVLLGVAARPVVFHEGHGDHAYLDERDAAYAQRLMVRDVAHKNKRLDKVHSKRTKPYKVRYNQPRSRGGRRG